MLNRPFPLSDNSLHQSLNAPPSPLTLPLPNPPPPLPLRHSLQRHQRHRHRLLSRRIRPHIESRLGRQSGVHGSRDDDLGYWSLVQHPP